VIVVIGSPVGRLDDGVVIAAGMSARVAIAAAGAGRSVQLVGKIGDDPTADGVLLHLARAGVGHVALLRDPAHATPMERPGVEDPDDAADDEVDGAHGGTAGADPELAIGPALEAADVELGLAYLTDFTVVVLAEPADTDTVGVVAAAARWGEARMIVAIEPGSPVPASLPADVVVFEAPAADPDGVFAGLVGTFAAALDAGTDPGVAFQASIAAEGWTGAEPA
jgi:hypothetical protein